MNFDTPVSSREVCDNGLIILDFVYSRYSKHEDELPPETVLSDLEA